jgi:hypothetical protein
MKLVIKGSDSGAAGNSYNVGSPLTEDRKGLTLKAWIQHLNSPGK